MKIYYRRPEIPKKLPTFYQEKNSNKIWFMFIFALIIIALAYHYQQSLLYAPVPAPGILVNVDPIQIDISPTTFKIKNYTITKQAQFRITARVVSKHYYSSGRNAELSPVDLAVGWGKMSDSSILNKLDISQSNRWYYWQWSGHLPIDSDYIIRHSANIHIIPANNAILNEIDKIRINNVISMQGYLINVTAQDFEWNTSLRRDDTGDHSCEVMWLTAVRIIK